MSNEYDPCIYFALENPSIFLKYLKLFSIFKTITFLFENHQVQLFSTDTTKQNILSITVPTSTLLLYEPDPSRQSFQASVKLEDLCDQILSIIYLISNISESKSSQSSLVDIPSILFNFFEDRLEISCQVPEYSAINTIKLIQDPFQLIPFTSFQPAANWVFKVFILYFYPFCFICI